MYIHCKSCGQLLYIPDDENNPKVCCPACQTEFVYEAETNKSNEKEILSEQPSEPDNEIIPPAEPLPEFATRESYHQSRNLNLQPFSSWDALLTAYRIFSERFVVLLLFAVLASIPNGIATWSLYLFAPELVNLQNSSSENQSFAELLQECQEVSKTIPTINVFYITGINILAALFSTFFIIGGIRLFNAYGRKQKASFWLSLSGFDSPGRVTLFYLMLFVLSFAFTIIGTFILLVLAALGILNLGIFLIMFLLILFMGYLFFVLPLIADSNLSAPNAFQLSFIIARRNIFTLIGTISLIMLIMMIISFFVMGVFGSFLSNAFITLIAQILYEPIIIGVISVAYLKATGQFRK